MKISTLKKNFVLSTSFQILSLIVPLITAPYVSRVLGADGVGTYSYTHAYSMYFCLVGALGTAAYGTREIARSRDDRQQYSLLFWEIAFLSIITSFVSIIGWLIFSICNTEYSIYYLILSLNLLATMFDISWFYNGLEQFKLTVLPNAAFKIVSTIAIFIFVKSKDDLWRYVLILSSSTALANVFMWKYLSRYLIPIDRKKIRILRHLRQTLIYFIPSVATSVYTILDKTLIGLITHNTSENGNYEQATKIINMAKSICFTGINAVLQSRISYLFAKDKYDEIKKRILVSIDYILFMGFGLCFGIVGVSKQFVPVFFGEGYEPTVILLQILSPLVIIIGISNCLGTQYYNPAGLRKQSARYIIVGCIINLILNILFIPRWKSVGAAIATLVGESCITMMYIFNSGGYIRIKDIFTIGWKKAVAGISMLIALQVINIEKIPMMFMLMIRVFTGAVIYFAILYILKDSFVCSVILKTIKKMGIKNRTGAQNG